MCVRVCVRVCLVYLASYTGVLLIRFLEYYGVKFDYQRNGISITTDNYAFPLPHIVLPLHHTLPPTLQQQQQQSYTTTTTTSIAAATQLTSTSSSSTSSSIYYTTASTATKQTPIISLCGYIRRRTRTIIHSQKRYCHQHQTIRT